MSMCWTIFYVNLIEDVSLTAVILPAINSVLKWTWPYPCCMVSYWILRKRKTSICLPLILCIVAFINSFHTFDTCVFFRFADTPITSSSATCRSRSRPASTPDTRKKACVESSSISTFFPSAIISFALSHHRLVYDVVSKGTLQCLLYFQSTREKAWHASRLKKVPLFAAL